MRTGFVAAAALIALYVALTNSGAIESGGGVLVALTRRALDPAVAGVPDRTLPTSTSGSSSSPATSTPQPIKI